MEKNKKSKLKNFINSAALAAGITASGMLMTQCFSGPQIDFGENTEEVYQQMTEKNALRNSIMDFVRTDSLLEKLAYATIHENATNLSKAQGQVNARLKEVIKEAFARDIVSREMPFTAEAFNKRCDSFNFYFGNFSDEKKNGYIKYPDIYIDLEIHDIKISSDIVAATIIHEMGHGLGCQLESMTELFEKIYTGYEPTHGPDLTKASNKLGDITRLKNKYDTTIEIALKNKVGVKECFRAALTSPKAVEKLWNSNMKHIMNYDKVKKLNDNLKTNSLCNRAVNNIGYKNPNFTPETFSNDGNAILSKALGLSEYNRNDPYYIKEVFFNKNYFFLDHDQASLKVYAFSNPLLQDIPLKNKENLDRGGFLVTRDLTNDYCKEGLNRYADLFNYYVKSAESTTNSDINPDSGPPIELDR